MKQNVMEQIRPHLSALDGGQPVPGFPSIMKISETTAVRAIVKQILDADTFADATLKDATIPRETRGPIVMKRRAEAAAAARADADKHLAKLDEQIAEALPAPTRPAVSDAYRAEVFASTRDVGPDILESFYQTAPPEIAAVFENSPPVITVTKAGIPIAKPRIRAAAIAARKYADAPEAARARHDGLRQIRESLATLAAVTIRALTEE